MPDCECQFEAKNVAERRTLRLVLAINATMFVVEFCAGLVAESTGLLADSLDMFADAGVYALSLFAIGRSQTLKYRIASISGMFQIMLGLGVLTEVGRRFFFGGDPKSLYLLTVGGLAFVANVTCLMLLAKHRQGDVNMRASWIFSTNDVLANVGVIVAGALVAITASRLPDLAIGLIISVLVVRGGFTIIREARDAQRQSDTTTWPIEEDKRGRNGEPMQPRAEGVETQLERNETWLDER